uniref:Spatacsin C-terminal domain-containing protein n=1 Tax=Astyanax mexicanus TaxID=7994 RepID=A0A8B9GUZ2_ASTMX
WAEAVLAGLMQKALEVALLPENDLCKDVHNTVKAKMAKGCSLLCCLNAGGKLAVSDVSERGGPVHVLEDSHTDFFWEVLTERSKTDGSPRLLTVGPACELRLHEVDPEIPPSLLFEYPAHRLLQLPKEKDSMNELVSAKLLSFSDGRCFLLLNMAVLVQLLYVEGSVEPEAVSSCLINLPPEIRETFVDYQLCRSTLFVLTSTGFIYVFDSVEGKHLATVNLPEYYASRQREAESVTPLSSFCLLHISQDLSMAVAATSQNQALALDLNDYFRIHTDQLLCQQSPTLPPLIPTKPCDQDSISSVAHSQSVLGINFQTDHSWEARLKLLYKKAKAPEPPALRLPWYGDVPNSECRRMAATANLGQPCAPPGGILTSFTVPEQTTPTMLNVSEFSVVLTFTSAGNSSTMLAHWDLESQSVTYHCADAPAAPVRRSEEEHLSLILKESGLSLVLFTVSQEELLNRLMVFGSAGVVDSLCHLNDWGRCSMPIHALQAGLKNRQLDMVDFFLKSKENILCPPTGYGVLEQSPANTTQMQLKSKYAQDLCPALDLLHSAIRDTYAEAQSQQFCEQLLNITLNFLNTQIRVLLSSAPELDANLQECVKILSGYISELRTYLRKYPWLVGGDQTPAPKQPPDMTMEELWESLSVEDVVKQAILCSEIPRAQAYLRKHSCPEQKLEELRRTGLRLAFNCLTHRDLQQATTLLTNMGFNVKEQLHSICVYTADRDLRAYMVEELKRQNHLSSEEMEKVEFIKQIENLCSAPAARCLKAVDKNRVLQISQSEVENRALLQEMHGPLSSSFQSLLGSVRLDWVRHWDNNTQKTVLLSRLPEPLLGSCDPAVLWSYLTSLHDQTRNTAWLTSMAAQDRENTAAPQWPALTADIVNGNTCCSGYMRDQILDMLARLRKTKFAFKLLDSIPTVPLAELGCTVELLILAHDCFSLTCNMEGIVKVLQAARHLSHKHLAHGEGYGLLVRLLTGIGRYNEMTYVFDLLNQNHRFEMLLRKKVESNTRLKTALLDYLKRCLPGDSEKHNMVALCFSMRREIGENHEGAARTQLKLIESQPWAVTPELKSGLEKVLFLLKDAVESYSKDSCMRQALRCVKLAKLITLQLHFLNHGQDHRVVNLRPPELLNAIVALPRCYQAFVVAEAYDYSPDWAEVLYQKVILKGDFSYLEEYKQHRQLSANLFDEISKKLLKNKPPNSASQNLKKLLQHCEDVYTHYELAYNHKFIDVANMLLQDSKTNSYLSDRLKT